MSDLQTKVITIGQDGLPVLDMAVDGMLLADDDGLATAVIISLFTDRLAREDDVLPSGKDRRGWWGDELSDGDKIGSRLWLNAAAKQLDSVLVMDQAYAQESLQWLVDDGVASSIDVAATNPRQGWRVLTVEIHRPNKPPARYQFKRFWGVE